MNRAERDAVEREVRRLIEASLFELFDLKIGQDRSLHLVLDRKEGRLSVGDAAQFNHFLRRELVTAGINVDSWSIDVESPGAFRELKSLRHFEKSRGERVRIVRRNAAAGAPVLTGILREVQGSALRIEPDGGAPPIEIRLEDVSDARLDPKLPF